MSQQRSKGPKPSNHPSRLLSNDENQRLFDCIGSRCVTLSSAVVQVFLAKPPACNQWSKFCCGVATYIKDNVKRSYYIRVFDVKNGNLLWEQEMYNNFRYKTPRSYFHTFDTDDCPAGLNFANEEEAYHFKETVTEKIQSRVERKQARRQTQITTSAVTGAGAGFARPPAPAAPAMSRPPPPMSMSAIAAPSLPTVPVDGGKNTLRKNDNKKDKGKKGKPRITKDDIGTPTDFRHVGHVGWDPDKGFDIENMEPELKAVFDNIGISETQLKDKETAQFIYSFLEENGGIEKLKEETQQKQKRTQAPVAPPALPSAPAQRAMAPPPPPNMGYSQQASSQYPTSSMGYPSSSSGPSNVPPPPPRVAAAPPPVPPAISRGTAPPPPPQRDPPKPSGPPPPPSGSRGGPPPPLPSGPPPSSRPPGPPPMAPPPPPGGGGAPPPPPPPGPPPAFNAAPPPPPPPGPPPPPSMSLSSDRANLNQQIQKGISLKPVDADDGSSGGSGGGADSHSQLLSSIRSIGQSQLKSVAVNDQLDRPKSEVDEEVGLAGALARALRQRQAALQPDDSESENEDDDEWDDN